MKEHHGQCRRAASSLNPSAYEAVAVTPAKAGVQKALQTPSSGQPWMAFFHRTTTLNSRQNFNSPKLRRNPRVRTSRYTKPRAIQVAPNLSEKRERFSQMKKQIQNPSDGNTRLRRNSVPLRFFRRRK